MGCISWLLRRLLRLLYGFKAYHEEVLNAPGPVLLIPNHVSWLDWLFVGVCLDDDWKFVTSSVTARTSWIHRWIMVNRRTFPIDPASPYAVKRMAEFLQQGGRLVLFAEGRISRTGSLMKLFEGTGFLLYKTKARVITAYLRGANRIPWVRQPGWTQWFPRLSTHFSDVLTPPELTNVSTTQARGKLTRWLRDQLVSQQFRVEMEFGPRTVPDAIAAMARSRPNHIALEDATRQQLTYRKIMVGASLLAQRWHALLADGTERVGVLLPNVNITPIVLLSLWQAGKVPAVLNYSSGAATLLNCVQLAGLKQIITSRRFLERARLDLEPLRAAGLELIYLEDVRAAISLGSKTRSMAAHFLNLQPATRSLSPASPAIILFTSGSEGVPKGVELSHTNLLSNIRQILAVTDLQDDDRIFNALPLFHSFGLTVGTLLSLVRGMYVLLYPSPLHYRMVPEAVYDLNCTVFIGTNTFLNGYARKAHPYDFRALRYLYAAAEKLQEATAEIWARRFGVRVLEGYGATECSPCVSVNTPMEPRFGSVGRFLPGIEYRFDPVEGVTEGGRLLVKGPNVMLGYLNPDANAQFKALDGWYDTGDIACVDQDGFLQILGRLKRFAKISGEMVSLTAVEDALAGAFPQYGLRCQTAVLSRPDPDKGEALIAVTNEPRLTLNQVREAVRAKGLSNLCAPRELRVVREIPKLGTGKTNHRELARIVFDESRQT